MIITQQIACLWLVILTVAIVFLYGDRFRRK